MPKSTALVVLIHILITLVWQLAYLGGTGAEFVAVQAFALVFLLVALAWCRLPKLLALE